jgi:hypothetical protein
VFGGEGLNDRLVLVTADGYVSDMVLVRSWDGGIPLEALDNNLLDIHLNETRDAKIP